LVFEGLKPKNQTPSRGKPKQTKDTQGKPKKQNFEVKPFFPFQKIVFWFFGFSVIS
jgi:hypothetical protein